MGDVDFLVAFTERRPDGSDTRRTEQLSSDAGLIGAYREASRRWMSGSAASTRYNLEVTPAWTPDRVGEHFRAGRLALAHSGSQVPGVTC